MRASRNEQQNDIDLATLPAVLKRHALTLLLAAATVGGLTYAGLSLVPSRYTSEAQIRIGSKGNAETAALNVDREAIASRVQELRSPDLARRLAAELKLSLRPEFNSVLENHGMTGLLMRLTGIGAPRPGETEEERVLAAYYRALQVFHVKETRVITLAFTARDGELAATAANRLIDLYQEWVRQQSVTETTDANAWLGPEIEKRTREAAEAEAAAERFRATANLFQGGTGQSSGLAELQLTDLASELTKARGQRGEAEARARAARDLIGKGSPDAVPDVQKSPVIQGLIAQRVRAERDLAEAATQLLPAHPRMKQLNAQVLDIRRQVQREAVTIVEGLDREVKVLALKEELAQRALEEAKSRVGDKAGDRIRLASLEDEAKAKRRELAQLRDRFEASRSRGATKSVPVEVQVIATALPNSRPSWPNRIQIASLAAAATFVLGLVLVLFRELLSPSARGQAGIGRRQEAAAEAAAPVLAVQAKSAHPPATAASAGSRQPPPETPAPAAAQTGTGPTADGQPLRLASVADVVARLVGNSAGQNGYRTVIVGETDATDVREEAADVAAGLAAAGRQVVLIDWSLEGRGIAEALGVPASPGFTDLMAGTHTFEDVIRTLPDGDVHVVPSGSAASGQRVLEPNRLNLLLDALDEAYADVVLTGSYSAVRDLFLAIEGRFDAGVLVAAGTGAVRGPAEAGRKFLGFDVTDIDVLRLERPRNLLAARKGARGRAARPSQSEAATPAG